MSLFYISSWLLKWLLKQLCRTSWKMHININGDQKTSYNGLLNFQNTNQFKSSFHERYIHYSPNVTHKKHNLYIHTQNTTKFGNKSLRAFGANIWNTLPEYIKSTTSLLEFKKFIKTCLGPKYKCSVCKWEWNFLLNMIFVMHNISVKYYFLLFLYLNCCKLFEVFNPRINKAIIIILQ